MWDLVFFLQGGEELFAPDLRGSEISDPLMRREAWGTGAAAVDTAQPRTPAGQQGRRALPQTVQVAGPKSHDELGALAEGPTRSIFVYDLDSNIPASDLEHGLHGLFSVFGSVLRVSSLPGRLGALRVFLPRSARLAHSARLQPGR